VAHTFSKVAALADEGAQKNIRETVFAVGFPLDATRLDPQSSRGVLSGKLPDGRLQLSISVNPGNSGGPLIDENDRVFGVISARSNVEAGAIGLAAAVPLSAFRAALEREMAEDAARAPSANEQKLADLVSLLAHEGESLVRGAIQIDSDEAQRVDRQVRRLIKEMPASADAALLGAAFFWNRHIALQANDKPSTAARNNAVKLVQHALKLDPKLRKQSKFMMHVLSDGAGIENKGLAPSPTQDNIITGAGPKVSFEGDIDKLTLHIRRGKTTVRVGMYTVTSDHYDEVCEAPCDQNVPEGNYEAALSVGSRSPVDVDEKLKIHGPVTVKGHYVNNRGTRVAGWIILGVGAATGIVVGLYPKETCEDGQFTDEICGYEFPYLLHGAAIVAVSVGVGVVMGVQRDQAKIEVIPGVAAPAPSEVALIGTERAIRNGLSLRVRF
jgi:hypothetical protein